jgi:tRNA threonylcarbamoyl adenosine modification protein YjeE
MAKAIAQLLRPIDCLTLTGTLGAGKTTFMQHLGKALQVEEDITSPTFTILQHYQAMLPAGDKTPLYHMDAYRLESSEECTELGIEEMLENGVLCIEWPEICEDWLPADRIALTLELGEQSRRATVHCPSRQQQLDGLLKTL